MKEILKSTLIYSAINEYANTYNFKESKKNNKCYFGDKNIINFENNMAFDITSLVEIINLGYGLLSVLPINDEISLYLNTESVEIIKNLTQHLDYLDINYEVNKNSNKDVFEYFFKVNTKKVIEGSFDRKKADLKINLKELEDVIKNDLDEIFPEVFIISLNEEEKLHSSIISNSLRENGVKTEINYNNMTYNDQIRLAEKLNVKFIIELKTNDLNKGIIKIKDKITNEEISIDESEVVDYILTNI